MFELTLLPTALTPASAALCKVEPSTAVSPRVLLRYLQQIIGSLLVYTYSVSLRVKQDFASMLQGFDKTAGQFVVCVAGVWLAPHTALRAHMARPTWAGPPALHVNATH